MPLEQPESQGQDLAWNSSARFGGTTIQFHIILAEDPRGTEEDGDAALQFIADLIAATPELTPGLAEKSYTVSQTMDPSV